MKIYGIAILKDMDKQLCEVYKSYMKEYKRIERFDLIDKN
jgi:hypothetical protein